MSCRNHIGLNLDSKTIIYVNLMPFTPRTLEVWNGIKPQDLEKEGIK